MSRHDIEIPMPNAGMLGAWMFLPADQQPVEGWPAVVIGEGLGGIKEMSLDMVGTAFASEGLAVIAFDYPHFGTSDGEPRQLVVPELQVDAYRAAVAFAAASKRIDANRIAMWGASFGGGHVLRLATSPDGGGAACSVAVAPFLGIPLRRAVEDSVRPKTWRTMLRDTIPLVSPSESEPALMQSEDAYSMLVDSMGSRVPLWRNEIASASMPHILRYRPVRRGATLSIPTRVVVATEDAVNPPGRARTTIADASFVEVPGQHFDIYGTSFASVIKASVEWLEQHLRTSS